MAGGAVGDHDCRAIRVGYLTGMAGRHTRKLLEAFRREAGDVTVDLVQLPWAEQVAAVLNGRVDAALVRAPLPDAEVRTVRLVELYPRPDLVHRPIVDIAPTSVELVLPSEPGAPLVELFADVARRAAPLTG